MRGEEFDKFFKGVSSSLPVSLLARAPYEGDPKGGDVVDGSLGVFEALDLLKESEFLFLADGRIIKRKFALKRPVRILFFVLLTEVESRLYRIHEWTNIALSELNEKNMNDFVRALVESEELFSYQKEYLKRSDFRDDLKAISSLRNLIVHVNKKLEMETDFETVCKRKEQIFRALKALDEILGELKKRREK